MVKIRLMRLGSKRKPFYRIVVADSKRQRDGKYIELVGTYNPKLGEVKVEKEIALKWLGLGAQPTPTVKNIFSHEGIIAEFHNLKNKAKLNVVSKSGQRFGKEVDQKKNYTSPGTKAKTSKKEEQAAVVEEVKEESKAGEVKEETKVEKVKEETKAEEVKEESRVEEVKEETKVEQVKEEAKVEEVKKEAKVEEVKKRS